MKGRKYRFIWSEPLEAVKANFLGPQLDFKVILLNIVKSVNGIIAVKIAFY
jgi:hypothetical protein